MPWFRFGSRSRSAHATEGWYCVYLFDTAGTSCYLSLNHGSTVWTGVDFKPRPMHELGALGEWGRKVAQASISQRSELTPTMALQSRRSNLGPAYEASCAIALRYDRARVPADDVLVSDALFFGELLGQLYRASDRAPLPVGPAPEVVELLEVADKSAGKQPSLKSKGQGFRLTVRQRLALEQRAMALAEHHLRSLGWEVEDTSSNRPYDFYCADGSNELYVEVKGTTSAGETVVLTRGEVEHHRLVWPNNALIVVAGMELDGEDHDLATGGELRMISPWEIADDQLTVVSYTYDIEPIQRRS